MGRGFVDAILRAHQEGIKGLQFLVPFLGQLVGLLFQLLLVLADRDAEERATIGVRLFAIMMVDNVLGLADVRHRVKNLALDRAHCSGISWVTLREGMLTFSMDMLVRSCLKKCFTSE